MDTKIGLGVAMTGVFLAGTAMAMEPEATLQQIQGRVMVNQGQNYVVAREGMQLMQGDRVMVLEGASALVSYEDGCITTVKQNSVLGMDGKSVCATTAAAPEERGPNMAALGTANAAAGAVGTGGGTVLGMSTGTAAAAAGLGAIAVNNAAESTDDSSSP